MSRGVRDRAKDLASAVLMWTVASLLVYWGDSVVLLGLGSCAAAGGAVFFVLAMS